jgi:hypothetical protein
MTAKKLTYWMKIELEPRHKDEQIEFSRIE